MNDQERRRAEYLEMLNRTHSDGHFTTTVGSGAHSGERLTLEIDGVKKSAQVVRTEDAGDGLVKVFFRWSTDTAPSATAARSAASY